MAKSSDQKSLVIVESPAKAKTIAKFLGADFTVEASVGHVRDLPTGKKQVPDKFKNEEWAYMGVNYNDDFEPIYIVPDSKKSQVTKLRKLLKESKDLYLATDEDREGEAISWHLYELLKPKVPVHRLVFHEITRDAIQQALDNPREIDDALVRAQETRRILDRLYGYEVSPLLWRKVKRGLSAGRVQSVATRMIVVRERERQAFVSATYWDLIGEFQTEADEKFTATLVSVDGQKIPRGSDFDSSTGKLKDPALLQLNETGANKLIERLQSAEFKVTKLEEKPYTRRPAAPFTTSTMQQEANRKLGFSAKRTMQAAQSLYENGYITYMRTDSTSLAKEAVAAARDLVRSEYGEEFLPQTPPVYKSKQKNAQEAHEAIRPAGHPFRLPDSLKSELNTDQFRLFELIWKRTIASQMENARGKTITITLEGDGAVFQVSGRTIEFHGFLRAYVEGSDDPAAELADKDTLLPSVIAEQLLKCLGLEGKSHTTQPPARFTEASLTKTLEEEGIGRPSTYASIIETILVREYAFKKGNALVPTWIAFSVVRLLEQHLSYLVDYQFTAQMEDFLDAISRSETGHLKYLQDFFFGNGRPGLKAQVESKIKDVDALEMARFLVGTPEEGEFAGQPVYIRVGKYGPFIEQGERKPGRIPEDMAPDELTLERTLELLEASSRDDEPLGVCPDTHKPIFLKQGRFGPYIQLGANDDEEKRNASLLPGMDVDEVTLEVALKLLTLPRNLGNHPENGQAIEVFNGRYGPYIKCEKETRSLPADISPLDITQEQALHLLSQPKTRGRAAPKEPIKVFDPSPVTEQPIKLLEGRYGPYVTDGENNASIPKGSSIEELTFQDAVSLLEARAAKVGSKKKKKKKKAAKKKSAKAKKKASKKKAAKKKAAKKKAAVKKVAAKEMPSAED